MKRYFQIGIVLLVLCAPVRADVVVAGSSTILPVAKRVAAEFTDRTGIRVRVGGGGSDHGAALAKQGKADIGMASRALHADESGMLVATPVALDAVAVFVHERNPLAGLTAAQLARIYRGEVERWREIDPALPDTRIVRVGKWHGRSTRELFDRFFGLAGQDYPQDTHMIGANVAGILYVSVDPQAIGYVSVGSLDHAAKQGAPVKILPIDGVFPTAENLLSGRYPYARPLNLVTRGQPKGEAARFVEWMTGPAGQRAALAEGFVVPAARP